MTQALRRPHRRRRRQPRRSSRASSSRCSGPRDAARRRPCGCSPASRCRPRAGSCSRASRSRTCRPTSATSTWSSRATRCSSTSTSPTTSPSASSAARSRKDEIKRRVDEALELVSLGERARARTDRALGRPAPAGRAGPGARQPAEGAAARRAARRARPEAAPADAGRAQADPARGRDHVRLRHPRPGGGALDVGPDRGDERRARRPVRGARGRLRAPGRGVRRRLHRDLEPDRGRRRGRRQGPDRDRACSCPPPLPDDCRRAATRSTSRSGPRRSRSTRRSRRGWSRSTGTVESRVYLGVSTQITVSLGDGAQPGRARAGDLPRPRRRSLGARAWRSSSAGTPRTAWSCGDGPRHPFVRVAVVGAGLAGLAAADALARRPGVEPVPRGPRPGRRAGSTRASSATAPSSRWAPSSSCPASPRSWARRALRARALGQGHALRAARSARRHGARGGVRGSGRRDRRGARGAARSQPARRCEICSTGSSSTTAARQAILARAEVSAAASADLVPASELALLARVSDLAAPGDRRRQPAIWRRHSPARSAAPRSISAIRSARRDRCGRARRPHRRRRARRRRLHRRGAGLGDRADRLRPAAAGPGRGGARGDHLRPRREALRAAPIPGAPERDARGHAIATGRGPRPATAPGASRSSARSPARPSRCAGWASTDGPDRWVEKLVELRADLDLEPDRALLSTWDDDPWVGAAYSVGTPAAAGGPARGAARADRVRRRAPRRRDERADGGRDPQRSGRRAGIRSWPQRRRQRLSFGLLTDWSIGFRPRAAEVRRMSMGRRRFPHSRT